MLVKLTPALVNKGFWFFNKSWLLKLNCQAYISVLNPNEMISTDAVAVTFGGKISPVLFYIIPVFVAMSAFGAINSQIMTTSRLLLVASRSQLLSVFRKFQKAKPFRNLKYFPDFVLKQPRLCWSLHSKLFLKTDTIICHPYFQSSGERL